MSPAGRSAVPRWVPVLLLAAAGLYLAVRAWSAVQVVLSPAPAGTAVSDTASAPLVEQARQMDRDLAQVDPQGRNPLTRVYRQTARTTRPADPVEEAPPPPPDLRMLLFDEVDPMVQIAVEGILSPRLRRGDRFMGWRVDSITSTTAIVSMDDVTHSLTLRRAQ